MGNIPQSPPTPDVGESPAPTPYDQNRAAPEDFGAGAADRVEQTGQRLSATGLAYLDRQNAAVDEAAFGRAQNALVGIIANPKTGFLALKGADAVQKADEYTGKFNDAISELRGSMSEEQWRRVGYRIDRLRQTGLLQAATHEREQHDVVAEATFKGAEKSSIDYIAQLAGDPTAPPGDLRNAFADLVNSARNRATYRYGENPPADAVKAEALPLLHAAASQAMSEALATGNAKHASDTLALMGAHLGVDAKRYTTAVNTLLTQHHVDFESERILGASGVAVSLPGGTDSVFRVDESKVATQLAKLPAGTANRAEIERAVNQKIGQMDSVWKKIVAQQVSAAEKEGDPEAVGNFDMSKVSKERRVWLQQHDEGALIQLNTLQQREDARQRAAESADARAERAEQRATSNDNYTTAWTWLHDEDNKAAVLKMSREQYAKRLLDDSLFPGGMTKEARGKALADFDKTQKRGSALDEPLATTVKDVVNEALFGAVTEDASTKPGIFRDQYTGMLREAAEKYAAQNKGEVDTEKLRKYLRDEMAYGLVKDAVPGLLWGRNDKRMPRVEAEASHIGRHFIDAAGNDTVIASPVATQPVAAQDKQPGIAPLSPGLPTVKTEADFEKLPSGAEFISPDGKRRRKP